jgi:hypothetical protein
MKTSGALRVGLATLILSSSLVACMQGQEESKTSSEPVQVCLTDAGPCVDLPDAFPAPWGDDGGALPPPPSLDAGFPGFDAGVPPFPGFSDASVPGWPPSFGADAGYPAVCDPLDPKYYGEYLQAFSTFQVTPCFACTAGQCCYDGLACVAQ